MLTSGYIPRSLTLGVLLNPVNPGSWPETKREDEEEPGDQIVWQHSLAEQIL